jgi:hypothetical protein
MLGQLLHSFGRTRLRGSDIRSYGVPVMLFMPPTEGHVLVYSLDLLRPFVLHLFIWLEQLYDTPLGEDDPFSFCFYYTPQLHRKKRTPFLSHQGIHSTLDEQSCL